MARRPLLTLSGLFLCVCAAAAVWMAIDRRPPEWDHANHLERAVDCYRSLRIVSDSGVREILEASSFYPPVATCAAGLLYFVFPIAPLPWCGRRLFGLPIQILNRSFKQASEQQNPDPLTAPALLFYPRPLSTQL